MSIRISVHGIKSMQAEYHISTSWLLIETQDGSQATLFVPRELAERLEKAFHDWEDEVSGRETAPVSDDTDAVTDPPGSGPKRWR